MQLALAVRRGDHDAFRALYDRYGGSVLGLAQSVVRDRAVAEDIVHDVFLNFWRNPESYEPVRGQFAAWLLRVTRNRSIDLLRKRKPVSLTSMTVGTNGDATDTTSWIPDEDPLPEQQALLSSLADEVRGALKNLPPDHRRLLELAYYGGLTQREIALKVGKPLGTVKTQMRTSLMRLAQMSSIKYLSTSAEGGEIVDQSRDSTSNWSNGSPDQRDVLESSNS
jgi:RNA polymerase sigma-70 factor, ECF subfamily